MKLRLTVLLCLIIPLKSLSAAPDSLWVKRIIDTPIGYVQTLEATADGGFVAGGFIDESQIWLIKLDASGDTSWTKAFARVTSDNVFAVATLDGGYAIGGAGDPWIIRTDANGLELWRDSVSTFNDFATIFGLAQTADGGFIAAGYVDSSNIAKTIVVKLDNLGDLTWSRVVSAENDVVGFSVIQTLDGGYAVAGQKGHPAGMGLNHGWLLKLDAAGETQWEAVYGDTATASFQMVVQSIDGGYAMVGRVNKTPDPQAPDDGIYDLYLVKADMNGVEEWDGLFGNGLGDEGMALVHTVDGGFTATGMSMIDEVAFNVDAWFIHTDAAGVVETAVTYGGPYVEAGLTLVEIERDEYIIAGGYIVDFDLGPVDAWFLRIGNVIVSTDDATELPASFALHQNYPNPFNPTTMLSFDLPRDQFVRLVVYDILGNAVISLVDEPVSAGYTTIRWSGRDSGGLPVPSGVYIARLEIGGVNKAIKMVMLK